MSDITLKDIREHCDRQCVRYGLNKASQYYQEHYIIRELLDKIDCNLEEHDKEIRADERRKFVEWLANGNTFIRRIRTDKLTTIDELIAEYEKEQKNDRNQM